MSPKEPGEDAQEAEELRQRLEELERENEDLKGSLEAAGTPAASHMGWRRLAAVVLIVLGCITASFSVGAVWLNRTIMDTERWVATVGPLAEDPAIQVAVADYATDLLFEQVDVETLVEEALPPEAEFIAAPISNGIKDFANKQALKIVQSPRFAQIWEEANRKSHQAIIAVLTRQDGVVKTSGGQISIDLGAMADEVASSLSDSGIKVFDKVPEGVISGDYVIAETPMLAQAQAAVDIMNKTALILPLLAFGLLGFGIWAAPNRRGAVFWMGVGLMVAMVLNLSGIYLLRYEYLRALASLGTLPEPAAAAAYDIIFSSLRMAERTIFALGLFISAGAALVGPSDLAVRIRGELTRLLSGVRSDKDFGEFGAWIARHKAVLRGAGVLAGFVVLILWPQPTPTLVLFVALDVLIWLGLIELFGRERVATEPDDTDVAELVADEESRAEE